ncbi:Rossmann-like and DUF2520 domain-containing protein [Winogradskyella sp. KYW1333]|jgi:predicted short-subunit dehydrogenase-like oxidoreductase (DUF2520 family)|uniref:Rossmann-like and DUF2520 domain-containing protein n=1 Tax=unclassified Winogradskyella TaxID=2615021 RepID=UPI000DF3B12C|nr:MULTISPECIES: DUF2520 domain-containing protein [unclassified Winogradskyella]MDB4752465.1 DUF2520 domain-containing protein [Winogradskyella sp.]RCT54680.1 DUF2520 domain-containing protein [Winogradskyella sp. KYW1333]
MLSVILIGAGNVASHLFNAIKKSESASIIQWYNRTIDTIKPFQNDVDITDDLSTLKEADIYIMAVSDDSIAELSNALPFSNRLVAHTSGSVSIHQLDKKHKRAVFYPLQTFTKGATIDFSEVPICIECLEKENLQVLKSLAEVLGCKFYKINTEQRQTLHLSAVYVNNFVNQLYRIAHEISDAKSINFDILKPLIMETARKVQDMSPYMAQTGPAKRNDKKTIKRHLKQIESEEHKAIYQMLTNSIKKTHGKR